MAEARATAMNPKTVGLIVAKQMTAADLMGPAEVFSRAKFGRTDQPEGREPCCYRVIAIGIDRASCVTECGIVIRPHVDLEHAPPLDTVFVCTGDGSDGEKLSRKLVKWLKQRAPNTRRVAAVGRGIYPVAKTGLLDGRKVAAHWRLANDVALRFPNVAVDPKALFTKDGLFYSCAGGASAIDLSLSLIEEDFGRQIALNVARELVVHVQRSGEQEQYSEALQFQVQSCDRFANISTWILCNLNEDLSVETLAHKACMSPRNFSRLFKAAFGKAPADFVAAVRIAEARRRLEAPRNSIESIANSVGFRSADAFSRAFEREVGCRPSTYRSLLRLNAKEDLTKHQSKVPQSWLACA